MTETKHLRRPASVLAATGLLICALTVPAGAEMCTLDVVPASTLLVPYFEVDLSSNSGATTIFSVNNAEAAPALVHVTMWTDWSQPTVDFDMFLTGYDVITVNMRDVFNGNIPITADAASDGGDSISPHGTHPEWDGSFSSCSLFFPFFSNPVITGDNLTRVVNGHSGQDVLGNGCMGSTHGDGMARGFITIDSATRCSIEFPSDAGYFGGPYPVARNVNQLFGDYMLVDPANSFAVGAPLVHIEALDGFDGGDNGQTFYGRFTQASGSADAREPLASSWGFGYGSAGGMTTDLIVWRDPSSRDTRTFYTCGVGPEWAPLPTPALTCLNEQEDAATVCSDGDCLPLTTQRARFGTGSLAVPFLSGWCQVDLSVDDGTGTYDVDFPSSGGTVSQGWVGALYRLDGVYSGGLGAVQLQQTCDTPLEGSWREPIFADGFESGDLQGWSSSVP